jgi:hypothetical protein
MTLENWHELDRRLALAKNAYLGVNTGTMDLFRMHRAASRLLQEANSEWVSCRRRGQGSARFDHLLAEAEQVIKNFEGHCMLAKLMHKEQR